MHDALQKLLTHVVSFAPRLLGSLAIFAAFWVGGLAVRGIVIRVGAARLVHREIVSVLAQGLRVGVLAVGAIALKDVLANVVAGAIIMTYRPFHRDDRVAVAGFEGRVAEIDMRYTTIETEDRRVLAPNSTVLTSAVSALGK